LRKGIIVAIGALTLLAGCGHPADKAANVPTKPKWQGAPYHIAFDTKAAKPNPSGLTIPAVMYTANPEALEKRATLVVRFEPADSTKHGPMINQMILAPVDIPGAEGVLPADYMDLADKGVSGLLTAYGFKGKLKVSVALANSSLNSQAGDSEIETKRMSDWLPTELPFKMPHAGH